jgi:DNA-binding transcriptional MerR regulator
MKGIQLNCRWLLLLYAVNSNIYLLMNIREFSKITGLSAHTIRYYEKIGVFKKVNRNSSGHRDFTVEDTTWAEFIKRLKDTGMPLEQILEYAHLREQGPDTTNSRMKILENHARSLESKIEKEMHNLLKLKEKIKYYRGLQNIS